MWEHMNKKIKIFILVLTVLIISIVFVSCSASTPLQKIQHALNEVDKASAIDMSVDLSMQVNDESAYISMQFKWIEKNKKQNAYIYSDANGLKETFYFFDEIVCQDYGFPYVSTSELSLDEFFDTSDTVSVSFDIEELIFSELSIVQKKEDVYDVYTITLDETSLEKIFGEIFTDNYELSKIFSNTDMSCIFELSIWLDNKGKLSKLNYSANITVEEVSLILIMDIKINAINKGVSIDVPEYVTQELKDYYTRPKLTLIAEPASCGKVIGQGRYTEHSGVSISAHSNNGYAFDGWFIDDELISKYYNYYFDMPSNDITITAKFGPNTPSYDIYVYSEPSSLSYYDYFSIREGRMVTLNAKSYEDYIFIGWFIDGEKVSGDEEYIFTMPGQYLTIKAKYDKYIENYSNTKDGAVKYYELEGYKDLIYDAKSNKIITIKGNTVNIYSTNITKEKTLSFDAKPVTISADNGILAIGFGDLQQILLYDLSTNNEIKKIQTSIDVYELAIDGDIIIYTSNNQWCDLIFYSISKNIIIAEHEWASYQPLFTINRTDHILYLAETGSSSSNLIYYNSQTGELIFESQTFQFGQNYIRALFDGNYVNYCGGVFDRKTGLMISSSNLSMYYNDMKNFTPLKTVYNSNEFSFVYGINGTIPIVGIYDIIKQQYIYRFNFAALSVEFLGGNKYLIRNMAQDYVAILDLSLISKNFGENLPIESHNIEISQTNNVATIKYYDNYTLSAADDKYIYVFIEKTNMLIVYDIITFNEIYTEKLLIKPECLDAYDGKLVIGFGKGRQFWIFDANNWSCDKVMAEDCVDSIFIYDDIIIFIPVDQVSSLYVYSINEKSHITLKVNYYHYVYYYFYYPSLAINREDKILYIGGRNSSGSELAYIDLNALVNSNTIDFIYKSSDLEFQYNKTPVIFDGQYVYYNNKVFDKKIGSKISNTNVMRQYNVSGFNSFETIYDDNSISVFIGVKDGTVNTYFYDLNTQKVFYELSGSVSSIIKTNYGYVILNNTTNIVKIYQP